MKILKSLHGLQLGLSASGQLVAPGHVAVGEDGNQWLYGGPQYLEHIDDFLGTAILGTWGVNKGSDAGAVNFATNQALSGTVRATTGANAGVSMATNGVQINSGLNYQANNTNKFYPNGGTYVEVRVKAAAITTLALFVGFTNQIAALQMPINGAGGGNGLTVTAADAAGFLFDTTMTAANWWAVSGNNSVATTGINSGVAPVAATYDTLRVELDSAGNAFYFKNGLYVGRIGSALRANQPLTPVVAAFRRSAASTNIDLDYIACGSPRV